MNSNDKRGWRLLLDINNAFKRDNNIDEFDFIPVVEPKKNCSPVVLVENKLGIELWSVKILYQYAYNTLMDWSRKTTHRYIESKEVASLTRAVVLVNAECLTAWNIRKELVESGDITILEDLKLSALVLTKHPKSSETFCHRRWLLSKYIDNHLQSSQGSTRSTGSGQDGFVSMDAIDLNLDLPHNPPTQNGHVMNVDAAGDYHSQMKAEIRVCVCAAERYPCNYYAWSHRIWLIQNAYNCATQVLLSELQATEDWVNKHISDTCGYHYRQFLLTSLHTHADKLKEQFSIHVCSVLEKELKFVIDLIVTFPGHEAMWCHRKYVFHHLHGLYVTDSRSAQTADNSEDRNIQKKTRLECDSQILQEKEIETVQNKCLTSKNTVQKLLAERYINWMNRTIVKDL